MPTVEEVEEIERASASEPLPELVRYLSEQLGNQAVAYLAGMKDAQMVGAWKRGHEPRGVAKLRIRYAYQAARMLIETFDAPTAEGWLWGSNSRLDDEAPAWIIRNAENLDALRPVIPATKAFVRPPE